MAEQTNGFDYGKHSSIGQCLLRTGAITAKQLGRALKRQGVMGGRLGDVAVAMGFCSSADVDVALEEQERYRTPVPASKSDSTTAFRALQLSRESLSHEIGRMTEEQSGPIKIKL